MLRPIQLLIQKELLFTVSSGCCAVNQLIKLQEYIHTVSKTFGLFQHCTFRMCKRLWCLSATMDGLNSRKFYCTRTNPQQPSWKIHLLLTVGDNNIRRTSLNLHVAQKIDYISDLIGWLSKRYFRTMCWSCLTSSWGMTDRGGAVSTRLVTDCKVIIFREKALNVSISLQ